MLLSLSPHTEHGDAAAAGGFGFALSPFGAGGTGSDEHLRIHANLNLCFTPVTNVQLQASVPSRTTSLQFQQLNSRLEAPRPQRAAHMHGLAYLTSPYGSPQPHQFSRSPSPRMASPHPLLPLPTPNQSHGQRSRDNSAEPLPSTPAAAASVAAASSHIQGLLYADKQPIGIIGAASPLPLPMPPMQTTPPAPVLLRRTTSTREETQQTPAAAGMSVPASVPQVVPPPLLPAMALAEDATQKDKEDDELEPADAVQAPAAASAAELKAAALASRMSSWWATLSRYPALDHATREHIRLLDVVMEKTCARLQTWSGSEGSSAQSSGTTASRPLQPTEFVELMERVSSSFCAAGEKIVEHFVRIAQQCDEQQAALREAANSVNASNQLLYDDDSTSSGASESIEVASPEPSRRAVKKRRTTASPKSIISVSVSTLDVDEDATSEESSELSPVVERPKGVVLSKKRRGEPVDDSSDSSSVGIRKRKAAVVRTKRNVAESFSDAAVRVLRRWLSQHLDDPYPDALQKTALAQETSLSYEQVGHWFVNARMRAWRPMLRERARRLAAQQGGEDGKEDGSDGASHSPAGLADLSAAAACMSELVPKAGRSYMCLDEEPAAKDDAGAEGSAATASGHLTAAAASSSAIATAELLAASALTLSIATSFQTPHSYIASHPLSNGGRKYKSGGSHKKKAGSGAKAVNLNASKSAKRQRCG